MKILFVLFSIIASSSYAEAEADTQRSPYFHDYCVNAEIMCKLPKASTICTETQTVTQAHRKTCACIDRNLSKFMKNNETVRRLGMEITNSDISDFIDYQEKTLGKPGVELQEMFYTGDLQTSDSTTQLLNFESEIAGHCVQNLNYDMNLDRMINSVEPTKKSEPVRVNKTKKTD